MTDLEWCIDYLSRQNEVKERLDISFDTFRALCNISLPIPFIDEFYSRQDKVIKEELSKKKIFSIDEIPFKGNIGLYKGDITLIKADAIVNACNEKLLGCFIPLHSCIDNAIHSFAGLEVRRDLLKSKDINEDEPNGHVRVTSGYNLPSRYIFHTVGPKVFSKVSRQNIVDLSSCYISCLKKAMEMNLSSIVFPCISTGVYSFPNLEASNIAFGAVSNFLRENKTNIKVIFNVFKDIDCLLYKERIDNYDN